MRNPSNIILGYAGWALPTVISALEIQGAWFGVAARWNPRRKRELSAWTVQIPASHFSAPKSLSTMGRVCQATFPKIH